MRRRTGIVLTFMKGSTADADWRDLFMQASFAVSNLVASKLGVILLLFFDACTLCLFGLEVSRHTGGCELAAVVVSGRVLEE